MESVGGTLCFLSACVWEKAALIERPCPKGAVFNESLSHLASLLVQRSGRSGDSRVRFYVRDEA